MIDFFIWHFRPKEPVAYTVVIESHALRSRVSKEWFAWRKKRAQVTRGLTADNQIRNLPDSDRYPVSENARAYA